MKKKILIIDDEETMIVLLMFLLGEEYNVSSVKSAEDALLWLNDNLADLVITDIKMQGMDGYQFLTQIRTRGYTKHTPIIILSANSSSSERVKCYRLGAQDFLSKPLARITSKKFLLISCAIFLLTL